MSPAELPTGSPTAEDAMNMVLLTSIRSLTSSNLKWLASMHEKVQLDSRMHQSDLWLPSLELVRAAHAELSRRGYTIKGLRWFHLTKGQLARQAQLTTPY